MSIIHPPKHKTILCLGDSYTIGESVKQNERFPEQTVSLLNKKKTEFDPPEIIARTGWTTKNLMSAIEDRHLQTTYDYVTLLIGVNDQFQGKSIASYQTKFEFLLQTAIYYAGNKPDHVIVLSIPDYGVTPFAQYGRLSPQQISNEIDGFNAVNKMISEKYKVHYIDITPISRKAINEKDLLATDGLHPSGLMYAEWAELLAGKINDSD
jgi:lysophospholipase L1-like esterase